LLLFVVVVVDDVVVVVFVVVVVLAICIIIFKSCCCLLLLMLLLLLLLFLLFLLLYLKVVLFLTSRVYSGPKHDQLVLRATDKFVVFVFWLNPNLGRIFKDLSNGIQEYTVEYEKGAKSLQNMKSEKNMTLLLLLLWLLLLLLLVLLLIIQRFNSSFKYNTCITATILGPEVPLPKIVSILLHVNLT